MLAGGSKKRPRLLTYSQKAFKTSSFRKNPGFIR